MTKTPENNGWGQQKQGFRILSPDIVLDQILDRFGIQIWVNFAPPIDLKSIQTMSGDFGTPKDAKLPFGGVQKLFENV